MYFIIYFRKEIIEEKPLVIPVVNNTKTTTALAARKAIKDSLNVYKSINNKDEDDKNLTNSCLTIEQKAALEIINDLKETNLNENENNKIYELPLNADELPLNGAKESTLDDYEKIPISQFGMAILRGMGFKEDDNKKKDLILDEPMVRPKGMGLGADKMLIPKPLLIAPKKDELLEIKKNAFIRIIAGKHKNLYGQIEGLDDHAGRVIVKLALGGGFESLNEFMVHPVTKEEYLKFGKVLNAVKYEEYKRKQENIHVMDVDGDQDYVNKNINNSIIKQEIISKSKYDSISFDSKETAVRVNNQYDCNSLSSKEHKQPNEKCERRSKSNSSDSDRYHKKYSHKNYKKHKKSSNRSRSRSTERYHRKYSTDEDDDNYKSRYVKKKTKKSKRQRSHSRSHR